MGNISSLSFDRTDAFTLQAWVKTSTAGNYAIVSKMHDSAPFKGYDLFMTDGMFRIHLINSWAGNAFAADTNISFNDYQWHHIAVTYDGSSTVSGVTVYVNDILQSISVDVDSLTGSTINTTLFVIGSRSGGSFFNGLIDDIRIYNRHLTKSEIQALYNEGN